MKNPNPNMLLRIAQGDACGLGVEYAQPDKNPEHAKALEESLKFDHYVESSYLKDVKAGFFTDDTQMSIAVAEALLEKENPTAIDFADHYIKSYGRDKRKGYSKRVEDLLEDCLLPYDEVRWNHPRRDEIFSEANSDFNGAAMRAVPIGVLPDSALVKLVAMKSALWTHDTPGGVLSAQAVALMSHFALYYDDPFQCLPMFLHDHLGPDADRYGIISSWEGRVAVGHNKPGMGLLTARAVHSLLTRKSSLMDIMRTLLMWGGDTDSVAAIAWGIASTRYTDEVLPEFFERDLERNPDGNETKYGVTYLKDLGKKLMDKYR